MGRAKYDRTPPYVGGTNRKSMAMWCAQYEACTKDGVRQGRRVDRAYVENEKELDGPRHERVKGGRGKRLETKHAHGNDKLKAH